ncbi:MAG: hypothetical protein P857_589 [Candidatus Xenolissoclinum pacificiensis L6]|uniref:Uncharacterized protein n=1 Tax=Candidatus Xenolissoclinum pacificiensis L6 TaxID=1401685 RepID=W2V0W9_9RICK|nr:MAG: hypothetical protein P857_589 [Candidatus Xenolissoclinum pacificiensis L6]
MNRMIRYKKICKNPGMFYRLFGIKSNKFNRMATKVQPI